MTDLEVHPDQTAIPLPGVQRFRRRPDEVEAIKWTGKKNCREVFAFLGLDHGQIVDVDHTMILLPGDEDELAFPGDWIVKHDDAKFLVWPDADFTAQFEPAEAGEE